MPHVVLPLPLMKPADPRAPGRSRAAMYSVSRMYRSKTSAAASCLTAHGDHARTSELLLFNDVFEARLLASAPDADHFHEGWRTCDAREPSISGQSTRRREQSAGVR